MWGLEGDKISNGVQSLIRIGDALLFFWML
jgi:hypothetical protein